MEFIPESIEWIRDHRIVIFVREHELAINSL